MLDKGIGLELGNNLIGNRKCRIVIQSSKA